MYKMIYMGSYNAGISESVLAFKNIFLAGVILDTNLSSAKLVEERKFLSVHNIPELKFEDITKINPDIIFLCGYTKLLKTNLLDKYLLVNVHAGILPKWRGKNANCWAILNGEQQIGYTLHRVREGMDDGEIFDITQIKLEFEESYSSARRRIKQKFCTKLEEIFLNIITRQNKGNVKPADKIIYTCKLKPSDAVITNWNYLSHYLVGLFQVFADGSGVFMNIREKIYRILKMGYAKEIAESIGIAGAVLNLYPDGSILVKSADTAVKIYELADENGKIILPSEILNIGVRL